ncbi:MAG: hypothetical protein ACI9UK_001914 [Candidatus Krumholzibacteriia bacterium]|jgi:hypothetical protein
MKTLNNFTKLFVTAVAVSILALGLIGCSDDDDTVTGVDPEMGKGAMLRIVHASPNAPAVDVYAEGVAEPLVQNLAYTTTTPYLDLAPGVYNVQLRAAGASPTSPIAFETGDLVIPEGAVITAAAVGLFGSADAEATFRVIPLVEDWTDPGAGNAAVRIIHASADAPTVSIDVGNGGTPEVPDFERWADTGAAGVALPAGTPLDLDIWAGSPLGRVTAFQTPALPEANIIVIATGLLGELPRDEMGFGLLAIGPDGTVGFIKQNPTIFVLHASPDAPAVNVNVAGTSVELINNLDFSELSAAVQVPAGAYSLDIIVNSSGAVAATVDTPALAAGERYLAIASGFVGGATEAFTVLPYADGFGESASPLVRVVHASPDAPPVDVGLWDGAVFTPVADYSNLSFGDASPAGGLVLPADTFTIGVASTGTTTPAATFGLTLSSGQKAFAIATGSLTGVVGSETFRLMLVDVTGFPWQTAQVMPD